MTRLFEDRHRHLLALQPADAIVWQMNFWILRLWFKIWSKILCLNSPSDDHLLKLRICMWHWSQTLCVICIAIVWWCISIWLQNLCVWHLLRRKNSFRSVIDSARASLHGVSLATVFLLEMNINFHGVSVYGLRFVREYRDLMLISVVCCCRLLLKECCAWSNELAHINSVLLLGRQIHKTLSFRWHDAFFTQRSVSDVYLLRYKVSISVQKKFSREEFAYCGSPEGSCLMPRPPYFFAGPVGCVVMFLHKLFWIKILAIHIILSDL